MLMSGAVWFRRNELVALDLVITAVSTMFAFVAMIGMAPSGWCSLAVLLTVTASGCHSASECEPHRQA